MKEAKALRVVYYTDKKKNGAEALVVFDSRAPSSFFMSRSSYLSGASWQGFLQVLQHHDNARRLLEN
jgi:hypothetical protein